MFEEKEVDHASGDVTCGVFIPLPYDLAKDFPDKKDEDDSVPHITVLFAGDLSPCAFQKFTKVVRRVATCVKPFELDLQHYGEFKNKEGQLIPHMSPGCSGKAKLAVIHAMLRKAFEGTDIKIAHYYGPKSGRKVPYEVRYKAHATLAYLPKGAVYKGPKPTGSWNVNELEVWGHEKIRVPLGHNRYDQPIGLSRSPISIHYPMAVPDVQSEAEELVELRDSCANCIRKHLGQAAALMDEVKQGYPLHRWLVVGHLGEAASEALKEYPKLAHEIREHRIRYMKNPDYDIPIIELIGKVEKLVSEERAMRSGAVAVSTIPHRDRIKGGKADKNKPEDFDPKQLAMGVKVEREHTDNDALAREIAMDHLAEFPKRTPLGYYSGLSTLEKFLHSLEGDPRAAQRIAAFKKLASGS